jgi:hypothetical protein
MTIGEGTLGTGNFSLESMSQEGKNQKSHKGTKNAPRLRSRDVRLIGSTSPPGPRRGKPIADAFFHCAAPLKDVQETSGCQLVNPPLGLFFQAQTCSV